MAKGKYVKVVKTGKKAVTRESKNSPSKIGLFFGAGAEITYGLPSGGKFAIEIFRRSPDTQKQRFKELLSNLDRRTYYAADYLPAEFHKKRLNVFGKPDFTSLVQSSIEYRRSQVFEFLDSFDEYATAAIDASGITKEQFGSLYEEAVGHPFGTSNYQNAIRLNERLGDQNRLFGSRYFSGFLDILSRRSDARLLRRCLTAFLQLLVGCCGQKLASDLNEQIFTDAPEDISIFDDIAGVFQIEFSQAGLSAFEIILDEIPVTLSDESQLEDVAGEVCRRTLEKLVERCLDYQSLLDSHFRYVYDPKASWAKFSKICIFLNVVRDYILAGMPAADDARNKHDGYYHDLLRLTDYGLVAEDVGTTNYNNLLEIVCDGDNPPVYHLNGSVHDFYDPYLNQIVALDNPDAGYTVHEHILVPMLFTQSGIKPLTSIEMSRRYVELFDRFRACDAIAVIGFAFSGDDGHINGLFRELIQTEQKTVYICNYSPTAFNESAVRTQYRQKLRLEHDPANLRFIPVNDERRTAEGLTWFEALSEDLRRVP